MSNIDNKLEEFEEVFKDISLERLIERLPKSVYSQTDASIKYHLNIGDFSGKWYVRYYKERKLTDIFDDRTLIKCEHSNLKYAIIKMLDTLNGDKSIRVQTKELDEFEKRIEKYKEVITKYLE